MAVRPYDCDGTDCGPAGISWYCRTGCTRLALGPTTDVDDSAWEDYLTGWTSARAARAYLAGAGR